MPGGKTIPWTDSSGDFISQKDDRIFIWPDPNFCRAVSPIYVEGNTSVLFSLVHLILSEGCQTPAEPPDELSC